MDSCSSSAVSTPITPIPPTPDSSAPSCCRGGGSPHITSGSLTPEAESSLSTRSTPLIAPQHTNSATCDGDGVRAMMVGDDAPVSAVLSFLPWKDALQYRRVSRCWKAAVEKFVTLRTLPMPAGGRRDHVTQPLAAFLPFNFTDSTAAQQYLIHSRVRDQSVWLCSLCGSWNSFRRTKCAAWPCNARSPHQVQGEGCCSRLFFGQLPRENTKTFACWLIERVFEAPPQSVVNIESHQNTETNRGKGCGWVYFNDEEAVSIAFQFHHRVFVDVDQEETGATGVWVVRREDTHLLQQFVLQRATPSRPKSLPRSTLVVERPSNRCVPPQQTLPRFCYSSSLPQQRCWPPQLLPSATYTCGGSPSVNGVVYPNSSSGEGTMIPPSPVYRHDPYTPVVVPWVSDGGNNAYVGSPYGISNCPVGFAQGQPYPPPYRSYAYT